MLVVSDTSPILNLSLIDRLSLIREQFATVTIPKGVLEELRVGENLPGSKKILDALDAKWLQVEEVQDSAMLRILKRGLDAGEAEAIALALENRAKWILLDESEARRIAKDLGLKVTGALGILLRAYRQKRIPSLRTEMERLRGKAGFFISDHLFEDLLKQSQSFKDQASSKNQS
jgi:predicted nucleic acid-binding protein